MRIAVIHGVGTLGVRQLPYGHIALCFGAAAVITAKNLLITLSLLLIFIFQGWNPALFLIQSTLEAP